MAGVADLDADVGLFQDGRGWTFWNGRNVLQRQGVERCARFFHGHWRALHTDTHTHTQSGVCGVRGAGVSVSDPCTTKRGQWNRKVERRL